MLAANIVGVIAQIAYSRHIASLSPVFFNDVGPTMEGIDWEITSKPISITQEYTVRIAIPSQAWLSLQSEQKTLEGWSDKK